MEAVEVRGRFVWHQLLTRDVPGAKQFYPRVSGWQSQTWPLDPNYTVCLSAGVPTAGIMPFTPDVPADAPPHWLQYIGTRDVDGTAHMAVRLGGTIIKEPAAMKGAGRYAVLRDPQGAVFAVIDPENARAEAKGTPALGQFSWHELATTDHEAAFAFYSDLFGWDAITRMDIGPMGIYLIFGYGGDQKGGMYIKPPDMPCPPHWLPYLHVPNVDKAAPAVEAAGGTVIQAPMDVPGGGRIAIVLDPAGAAFALHASPQSAVQPPAHSSSDSRRTASPAKANLRAKAKAKTKAKMKPKAKPKPRVKVKAKTRTPVRKKSRGTSRVKAKVKGRAKTQARPRKKTARRKK